MNINMLYYVLASVKKTQIAKLTQLQKIPGENILGNQFGYCLDASSDGSVFASGTPIYANYQGIVYVYIRRADGTYYSRSLVASDREGNDYFGESVCLSGDGSILACGAPYDDVRAGGSGSVYVFTRNGTTFTQKQKLTASDGAALDYLGYDVVISSDGTVIVSGAHADDDKGYSSGSVYIFTLQNDNTYAQTQKLVASDGAADDYFGRSVSISGDGSTIVVGSYRDDDLGTSSGSAYIFTRQENGLYAHVQKLLASSGTTYEQFGRSTTISFTGDVIAIGTDTAEIVTYTPPNNVYVYKRVNGGLHDQIQILNPNEGVIRFGVELDISNDGNTIVVGATNGASKVSGSGCAFRYVLDGEQYTLQQKLVASDAAISDNFGNSIAITEDGSTVFVGAKRDTIQNNLVGSVYVYS